MIPELRERIQDSDRAVSPVIGVILMVAITVILAAVIAAFVLGFGADQDSAPQATWSVSEGDGTVTFTHEGGDSVDANQLELVYQANGAEKRVGGEERTLTGGSSITFTEESADDFEDGLEVRLVWNQPGGDDTSTLRTYTLSDQGE